MLLLGILGEPQLTCGAVEKRGEEQHHSNELLGEQNR